MAPALLRQAHKHDRRCAGRCSAGSNEPLVPDEMHSRHHACCPQCLGALTLRKLPSKVLCSTSLVSSTIVEQTCTTAGCAFVSLFDGAECFVLRKAWFRSGFLGNFELCLHWEVLYNALEELLNGTPSFQQWTRLLSTYKRMGMPAAALSALQGLFVHFRQACMDFEVLWNLDYAAVLRCSCAVPYSKVIGDGISISCKLNQLWLCGPWLPQQPGPNEPAVLQQRGSRYETRFAVADKQLRHCLRQLSHVSGLDAPAFTACLELCEVHGFSALGAAIQAVAFQASQVTVPDWLRPLLHELGCDSPACAVVPHQAQAVVEHWARMMHDVLQARTRAARQDAAEAWSRERADEARCLMPVLDVCKRTLLRYAVMQHLEDNHIAAFVDILSAMAKVRSACWRLR